MLGGRHDMLADAELLADVATFALNDNSNSSMDASADYARNDLALQNEPLGPLEPLEPLEPGLGAELSNGSRFSNASSIGRERSDTRVSNVSFGSLSNVYDVADAGDVIEYFDE